MPSDPCLECDARCGLDPCPYDDDDFLGGYILIDDDESSIHDDQGNLILIP